MRVTLSPKYEIFLDAFPKLTLFIVRDLLFSVAAFCLDHSFKVIASFMQQSVWNANTLPENIRMREKTHNANDKDSPVWVRGHPEALLHRSAEGGAFSCPPGEIIIILAV